MENEMPHFSNKVPDDASSAPFDLKRTPTAGQVTGYVTSHDLLTCRTHFANNRTSPCESPDYCKLCEEGFAWRTHVYLSLVDFRTFEHFLFETTAKASAPLALYRQFNGSLRGCAIRATRPSGMPNGRIRIETKQSDPNKLRLPAPPNIEKLMCHIWNIPYEEKTHARIADLFRPPPPDEATNGNGRLLRGENPPNP